MEGVKLEFKKKKNFPNFETYLINNFKFSHTSEDGATGVSFGICLTVVISYFAMQSNRISHKPFFEYDRCIIEIRLEFGQRTIVYYSKFEIMRNLQNNN